MSEIDPREFGKLEAQVASLQLEVAAMRDDIKALLEMANKSKGGMFVGMAIASVIGGFISFIATKLVRQEKIMMYGKSKASGSKMPKKDKTMPLAIMIAVGKPKAMPTRGGRTATNMMKKSSRGK